MTQSEYVNAVQKITSHYKRNLITAIEGKATLELLNNEYLGSLLPDATQVATILMILKAK